MPASHDDVPVVLHCVVGAAREEPCDGRPSVAMDAVGSKEPFFFLLRERAAVDPRVQLIEPPQPATFTWSRRYLT